MALSGSFTNYFQGNASKFHMTTSWSATQNIANNTSTITAITTVRPEGAISASASKNGSITIAGNTKSFTFVLGSVGAGVTKEVGRHTVTVSHAGNGTGSAGIASTLDIKITYSGKSLGSLSTSGTASLTTIPRTSTFTIPSSFTVGSAFTVSITRASSSFTHEISLHDGSTALYWSGNNVATSGSPNIAADTLVARMSGVASKAFTVRVDTYSGSTLVGTASKTITANIPVSTFTAPSSFNVGSAFTVSVSRIATQLTHWVILYDGSTSLYSSGNAVGTSVSPNVAANTLIGRMSGVKSKAFTVQVDTYNGSTMIGRQTKTITASIPASTFTIPTSFNVGSAFTASISGVSSSLTHRIELVDGSTSLYLTDATTSTSISSNAPATTLIGKMSGVKSKTFTTHLHTYNNGVWIANTTKTITANIPTSTFTIPTSFTMGSKFDVSISRVGSLTHKIELWDGTTNIYNGSSVADSGSVNVGLDILAARSPNAMSRTFRVDVDTYNGSLFVGKSSKNITANVPTSVKPTFSAITASENVSTVASLVGAYVQTKSKLNLAITGASGMYGSTITSYNITGVGHNVNSSSTVTGLLSVSGKQTITGTIIDSRGQPFSKELVVDILPYTPPTLSGLSFKRTLANKTEAPLGDNATVAANVKVHSLIVNGVQKNSIKYHVQSAQSGGTFADKANTTSTDLTKSYSDVWVGYSVDHSYNFRARAGDVFGFGSWSVGVVPTGVVAQQWGSKTTSFGKMIDNTSYNVQVGNGGIQSDGPIIDKNGNEVSGGSQTPAWSAITGKPAEATRWPAWSEVTSRPSNSQFPNTAEAIGASKNLNNYTTPGFYYQDANVNAANGSNYPVAEAGTLVVTKDAGTTQMYYHYNGNGVYYRTFYSSTWTAWKNLLTPAWASVSEKPTTFAPSTHNHTWSQLSGGSTAAIPTSGSSGTWTSVNMSGSKGGYAGIYFTDYARYFMVNASIQGFHTGSAWQWYFSNGALAVGSVPWSLVTGKPTIPAVPADYIVAAGSNYRKWNNGNLECWGMGRITTTSNEQTATVKVSFGHSFVNTSYSVTLGVDSGWPGYIIAGYANRAKDGLTIAAWRKDANWNDISYYANGRWK